MTITLTEYPDYAHTRDSFATRLAPVLSCDPLCDPITALVLAMRGLLSAELRCSPKFTESESFQLLQLYQGTAPEPFEMGSLLAYEAEDAVDEFGIETALIEKLYRLSPTQDWALRTLLLAHEEQRRAAKDPSLREMGFPLE